MNELKAFGPIARHAQKTRAELSRAFTLPPPSRPGLPRVLGRLLGMGGRWRGVSLEHRLFVQGPVLDRGKTLDPPFESKSNLAGFWFGLVGLVWLKTRIAWRLY